jgi:uncharacterized protein DUF349
MKANRRRSMATSKFTARSANLEYEGELDSFWRYSDRKDPLRSLECFDLKRGEPASHPSAVAKIARCSMALLDRFRSVPASKHLDPEVRLAYVESLSIDERESIASAALEDESARVRRAAVGKLMDPAVLVSIARDDADPSVRAAAGTMLRDIALEAFEETGEAEGLAAVEALATLSDGKIISQIAKTAQRESVARQALDRIVESRMIGSIARHAALEGIRRAAFDRLSEHEDILAVAMHGEFKDTAVAAVERLTDRAELEHVAASSTNRHAVKRARGMLRELDERAGIESTRTAEDLDTVEPQSFPEATAVDIHAREEQEKQEKEDEQRRALEAERERRAAEEIRQRQEQIAAEHAAARAAEEEMARREAERRRARALELVAELESAADEASLQAARSRVALVQREWKDLMSVAPADSALVDRYTTAEARLTAREVAAKEADTRARQEGLRELHRLLGHVEPLVEKSELSAKIVERAVRDVRSALSALPGLPSKHDHEEVTRRLKAVQATLAPKLQDLRAMEDWQRWANVGIQEALCEKMEALKSEEEPEEIARRVRELQRQWRLAADVPRPQGEALWRRFKTAHDEVWPRCETYFAAEAAKRADNLTRKIALCEQVEALAESTAWIQTAEEIKRSQAEWKAVGPVSRGQEKAVWDRFRVACDRFFTRRHDDLVRRKAMWAENLAKKDELCAKVEALADSTDWDATAAEIKRLQTEWRSIGPVKKNRSDAIWQRFRGACDRFFTRYAQRHEIARGERLAAREAICADLEALSPPVGPTDSSEVNALEPSSISAAPAPAELLATVRSLRGRWQQEIGLRGVDPARAAALDQRFSAAFDAVVAGWPSVFSGTDLDPQANLQRMEALVQRIESLAASLAGPMSEGGDQSLSPTTRLATMLKEALAANTIGGRVDEENRWRAAQEDVRQAQATWSRIGVVPETARRALTDRFNRACRRILERSGPTGKPAGSARVGQASPLVP